MLEKLKAYSGLAYVLITVVLIAGLLVALAEEKTGRARDGQRASAELASLKLEHAEAVAKKEAEYRTKEREWQDASETERKNTAKAKAASAAAYDSLVATNVRLSADVADNILAHRRATLAPTAAGERAAGEAQTLLYAELFSSARSRATQLAKAADDAYDAGTGCERQYDATR